MIKHIWDYLPSTSNAHLKKCDANVAYHCGAELSWENGSNWNRELGLFDSWLDITASMNSMKNRNFPLACIFWKLNQMYDLTLDALAGCLNRNSNKSLFRHWQVSRARISDFCFSDIDQVHSSRQRIYRRMRLERIYSTSSVKADLSAVNRRDK